MSTAADIITLALKDIQVLDETETPSAALMADALTTLNQMLAMWQADKMFIYAQIDTTTAATGATTYTVGSGGAFNISVAPVKLDYAFLRVSNIDYPIEILNNWEDYQSIALKGIAGTYPEYLYYNPTVPLSTIYVYPQPTTGTFHLISSVALPVYTASANAINLPAEYDLAIRFSLCELLAAMMGKSLRPDISQLGAKARGIIKRNNLHIKELDLGGGHGRGYLPILGDR